LFFTIFQSGDKSDFEQLKEAIQDIVRDLRIKHYPPMLPCKKMTPIRKLASLGIARPIVFDAE
jgi:hypothetical protein